MRSTRSTGIALPHAKHLLKKTRCDRESVLAVPADVRFVLDQLGAVRALLPQTGGKIAPTPRSPDDVGRDAHTHADAESNN